MHLNYPQTIPPTLPCQVCGKTVFCETGPWCQKVGDGWTTPSFETPSKVTLSFLMWGNDREHECVCGGEKQEEKGQRFSRDNVQWEKPGR